MDPNLSDSVCCFGTRLMQCSVFHISPPPIPQSAPPPPVPDEATGAELRRLRSVEANLRRRLADAERPVCDVLSFDASLKLMLI